MLSVDISLDGHREESLVLLSYLLYYDIFVAGLIPAELVAGES